jgi:hypothetical protein
MELPMQRQRCRRELSLSSGSGRSRGAGVLARFAKIKDAKALWNQQEYKIEFCAT